MKNNTFKWPDAAQIAGYPDTCALHALFVGRVHSTGAGEEEELRTDPPSPLPSPCLLPTQL